MSNITPEGLKNLFLQETPLIDVRAPVEFVIGTLPGAVNLPIMDDGQRAAVGTMYKQSGREEAMKLGHELVSGAVKESRLQQWAEYIRQNPDAILFCFRGGLRSKITQRWLSERGIERPLIEGGYKMGRQFLRQTIDQHSAKPVLILSGPTGSAKTQVLNKAAHFYPTVDLEALACHRGSAFGGMAVPQPSQIDFENAIAKKFLQRESAGSEKRILFEDESRLIGRCAVPESLFVAMRTSELIYLEETFEQRVENIFQDYVVRTAIGLTDKDAALAQFGKFKYAIKMISRKLGGARAQEILDDLTFCEIEYLKSTGNIENNRGWIAKLLNYYYDPAYSQSLEKRNPKILFRGNSASALEYLKTLSSGPRLV